LNALGQKISTSIEDAVKVGQQKIDLVRAEIKRREEEEKKQEGEQQEEVSNSNANPQSSEQQNQPKEANEATTENAPLITFSNN